MKTQEVWKALADPTRRQVLKLLQRDALTAGEIADQFAMTKASMSHHFSVLKAADLVRSERRGQQLVYSINTSVFEDVAAVVLDLFSSTEPTTARRRKAMSR